MLPLLAEALQLQQRVRGYIGGMLSGKSWEISITPSNNSSACYLTYKVRLVPSLPGTIHV
jgi:hypothetical protein